MTKLWQIYYNAMFGALGGLIAWLLVGLIPTSSWNVHLANAFAGAGIGLFIGGTLGVVDGLLIKRAVWPTILGGFLGSLTGVISGVIGLFLGGVTFLIIGGGLIARMLGWMALGLFLGLGQGILNGKLKRAGYSLIGGTLAGLVGGALYEIFTQAFLAESGEAQVFLSALGLILIGFSLGSIIPLSVEVISRVVGDHGMVKVLNGRRAGMEISFVGSATLGGSDSCDVFVPEAQEKRQAQITKGKSQFEIANIGTMQTFTVNGLPVAPGNAIPLVDQAMLLMGDTQLKFKVG